MEDVFQFSRYVHEGGDIVVVELKFPVFKQVFYVLQVAGNQVVHPNNLHPLSDKPVAEMGS